ncbi:ArsR/SmtB family transcription factor [Pseudomonas protegens]|jgi:ArsR family transcriptional regulator|uniref:Transcriptional regulator, ArsR family n=1 Tax=Pseudomonas protegens (strain DSM 19095 / LMG 27888 / CFBP 6595 / CHA0) TaxID=1124983 RepID=A0A2C9EV33_PSEPH|nr:metalloregulator ArsR/SmtB family transcription factor [Pseudomonas protegens]AGL87469.1 transcriptional regulator, ArsR family [Pseudomonas protegens CHA0]MBP5108323.1 metalloregulator ArsR/SmtB family transcription factor [Pseudomonas protegens]QTU27115.1 metalloregulator ArsR/SmtB family transcription factor [Pseudomonas protegens]QTU30751.1 metalloregulator ArsR/SmtB family transcription factor [Pseudomonas protegens]RLO23220.1 methyltransferase domain-containing protein [Pseudomonas pr
MNLPAPAISHDNCDELAALCKAGGDPLRLNVLRALSNDSFGVLELAQIFAIGQSGMSHHLKVLAQASLVATRREGNAIFYRRALPHTGLLGGKLHAALLEEVDQLNLPGEVQARISLVHRQRAAASQDFFSRVAEKFRAQQDLIAGLPQYRDSVLALLDKLSFDPVATAIEVGPGDGGFLPELARRFARVTALDNSPAMLELARQLCERETLANVSLQLADALNGVQLQADCVVLNMVLHHFAAPAEALKQMAQLLQPGGSLLVTDLCSHNQSWAKEACGDLWLGFEQDDLARWATAAGLTPGESLYVGLRNGFQIQVRHFQRPAGDTHHR